MRSKIILIALLLWFSKVHAQLDTINWLYEGMYYDSIKNYKKSIECYSAALKQNKHVTIALYNRAAANMQLGKYSVALVDLNTILAKDTSISNAYFNRFVIHDKIGNLDFALNDLDSYLKKNKTDENAVYEHMELCDKMELYDKSILDCKWLMTRSNDENLKLLLAELYAKNDKMQEAEMILMELSNSETVENDKILLIRAILLHKYDKYDESNKLVNVLLLNNSNNIGLLKLKADNLFYLRQFELALDNYKKIIAIDSTNRKINFDIGNCLLQLKLYSQAIEQLTYSLTTYQTEPGYAYLGRGIAYFNLEQGNNACKDWHRSSMLGIDEAKKYLNLYCIKNEENQ